MAPISRIGKKVFNAGRGSRVDRFATSFAPRGGSGAAAVGLGLGLGLVNSFDSEGIVDYAEDIAYGTTTGDEAIMGTPIGVGDVLAAAYLPRPSWGIPGPRFLNKQISSYKESDKPGDFRKSFYHSEDLFPSPTQANRRSSGSMTNIDGSIVFGMNNLKHG